MGLNWIEDLFGFKDDSPEAVRRELVVEGSQLRSRANGRVFETGHLETPNLAEFRTRSAESLEHRPTTVEE